jgi:PAS domain S-box-containing protein
MEYADEMSGVRTARDDATGLGSLRADNIGMLDAVDLPIIVISRDCTVARINRAARMVFGLKASDIGRSPGTVISCTENLDKLCAQVIADATPCRREIRDGDRYFLLRLAPYIGNDAEIVGAVLTFTNVTAFRASIEQAIYEREYTKAILNTVADPLVVLDAELRIQTANRAFYDMFGVSRHETQDVSICKAGNAEWETSDVWESIRTILSDHSEFQPVEIDHEFPRIGRRTILLDVRRLAREGAAMVLVAFHDISERKRAQEAIQQRTAQFETLLNAAPLGVYLVDKEFRIRQMNPAAVALFGDIPDLIGRDLGEVMRIIVPGIVADATVERVRHTLETGHPYMVAEEIAERFDRNGAEFYEWQINRIQLPEGSWGVVCYFRNISAAVSARMAIAERESELRRTNDELRRSNEDLNQFAFAASHDLQEPLRMITSYSQMLVRSSGEHLDGEASLCVKFITEGTRRMRELLADLLAYTQVNQDPHEAEFVNLNLVFQKEVEDLKTAIEESRAVVTYDDLPTVRGQEVHFRQLFQNLIGNALKYRSERQARIHVGLSKTAAGWRFSVADNGIGVDPEYHRNIFGVFKRLHGREIPGTGIGLAICQRVVERYGGRIWVESEVDRGCTFYFTLPATKGEMDGG